MLIIDDEVDSAAQLQEALSDRYEVVIESQAAEALFRLQSGQRFDFVLCDVMMPSVDGIEFHRRLALTLPDQAGRVVFMSGGAVESFLRRVPNVLLVKPVDAEGLRALIERRLGEASSAAPG